MPDLHNSSIPYCVHDAPVFKKSYCLSLLTLNAINSEAYEVDAKFSSTFSVFALVQMLGNDYPSVLVYQAWPHTEALNIQQETAF